MKHVTASLWTAWREFRLGRAGRKAIGLDRYDERYLAHNPDVADAVQLGQFRSGREHFVRFGWCEDRSGFDPASPVASEPAGPPETLFARTAWSLIGLWDVAHVQAAHLQLGIRAGLRGLRPSAHGLRPDTTRQPACVDFALRIDALTRILVGWSRLPLGAPTAVSAGGEDITPRLVSTHRRGGLTADNGRGFIAVVTPGDTQAMPASVMFGDTRVTIDSNMTATAFSQFCAAAAAETLFDFLRLAPELRLSDSQWKRLSRAAGIQLAPFTRSTIKTASVTASIDNAWSSGSSGAAIFHGRLIDADPRLPAECSCIAQAGRNLIPIALARTDWLASFSGAEFFPTVERRPTAHGLEPQVLDWIDFCRIGSGGGSVSASTSRSQSR